MAILDNRTSLTNADAVTNFEDIAGAAAGTADAETFIEGSGSVAGAQSSTSARFGLLYNNGSTLTLSGRVVYLWWNFAAAGLLATEANDGIAVRFTGATVTDWAERTIGGVDTYQGGWVMFVIDVDEALANADNTNGTPPTANNIQRIGITVAGLTSMPKMQDNFFQDAIWYVDSAVPAMLVEGQNSGPDWTWDDLVTTSEASAWGLAEAGPGGSVVLRGGVRFGANDAVTHGFSDTNKIVLFEQAVHGVPTGFYNLEVIGGSGTQSFEMGIKTGTGDDATGSQGCIVSAEATGDRWDFVADDGNVDACNLYGCQFIHGGEFQFDSAAVSVIGSTYLDGSLAEVHNSEQLRNSIVDANTADGVAFMRTDDINDIKFCVFEFSDGHAIELDAATPTAQSNVGNLFAGYTNTEDSTDAAILNSAAGNLTVTNSLGSNLATNSFRNTGGGDVTIVAGVPVTLTFLDDETGSPIEGLNVILGTGPGLVDVIDNILTDSSGQVDVTYTGSVPDAVEGFARKGTEEPVYVARAIGGTVAASTGLVATIRMSPD